MMNSLFYKEVGFWFGIILIVLDNDVLSDLFSGRIFTTTFWTTGTKIESIIFLVLGITLIIKSLFYVTERPQQKG